MSYKEISNIQQSVSSQLYKLSNTDFYNLPEQVQQVVRDIDQLNEKLDQLIHMTGDQIFFELTQFETHHNTQMIRDYVDNWESYGEPYNKDQVLDLYKDYQDYCNACEDVW